MSSLGAEEEEYSPKWLLLALAVVAVVVLAGVAAALAVPLQPPLSSGGTTAASGTVIMPSGVSSNLKLNFSPDVVTVIIGQNNTVAWINRDSATHTVTATDGSFNSGDITAGESWNYTFTTPGTYSYFCIYHSAWMKGTVIVERSGGSTGTTTSSSAGAATITSGTNTSHETSATTSVTTSSASATTQASTASSTSASSTTSSTGSGATVRIPAGTGSNPSLNYSPSSINVVIGVNNTVTFVNGDSVVHTVTAKGGSFDSGNINPGQSWTYTFTTPGIYTYHCIYHTWMTGTITVLAS
jgi:plastocyanin